MEKSTQQNNKGFVYQLNQERSDWLTRLIATENNQDFIDVIKESQFYCSLLGIFTQEQSLESLNAFAKNYFQDSSLSDIIYSLFFFFIRENCVGPSVYTEYVEEIKRPLVKGGPLPVTEFDAISNKNIKLQEILLKHFERDSEEVYHKTQFLVFFYLLEQILNSDNIKSSLSDCDLWKARFYYLYDIQLTSSVIHLKDQSLNYYESYINEVQEECLKSEKGKRELSILLVEQNYCYLNFYKYKEAKKCIKQAMKLINLEMQLTGRLGRRTKYQQFDIAQLVLDVKSREVQVKEIQSSNEEEQQNKQKLFLEEDTILYEEPKLTVEDIQKKEITVEDQLIIQAYVNFVQRSYANEETRQEMLVPYINTAVQNSKNWLVFSKGLLLRSRNEFERTKTKERSLLQIQTLIDQFRDKEPSLGVRLAYFPATHYPFLWQFQKELAKLYQKMGVFISAYELLREVELFEDCILCLFMGGRKSEAEKLAAERLDKSKSPAILCLLGDIKRDVKYYYQAWEESGKKYARAMRSIARQHFYTGEYKKAIESYEIALEINKLYPDAWFTLGCAYMRMEDWKGAIYAFGVAVSIDDHNYEAWCNISSCYMRQEKEKEAILCIEQALKHNRKNWKIWENYIIFSLDTMNFHKALSGTRELIRQDKVERVNITLLRRICDVFLKNYVAKQCPQQEFEVHKKQLYTFFNEYTEKVAKDHLVYYTIGKVKQILGEEFEVVKEFKLKELRALQIIGWETQIQICEQMEKTLNELIELYEQKEIGEEEKMFIRNSIIAIEKCLQRTSNVNFDKV